MLKRRLDLWLPTYVLSSPARFYDRIRNGRRTRHIIFVVCDHFEPRHGIAHEDQADQRVKLWAREYAGFQQRCHEAFGTSPKHTWFYPPHHGYAYLPHMAQMVFKGLGEVELHYHHDGDTSASLRANLKDAIAQYHKWGLLLESGVVPKTAFAFIHGDWALDNSAHGKFCGVNDELTILQELGCWGDFTMPSTNECQTRKINSIYYAVDNPDRPKSHNWGKNARVGKVNQPGLFMLQGPLGINWHPGIINWRVPRYPHIENASLTSENWGRPDRIRKWLDCHVHVRGRPEWVFVKLHTHGAIERDFDALFGEKAFAMHRLLNRAYNDGKRYRLHYVTAREAYNIAKAAESGMDGDPSRFYDFKIAPPPNAYYYLDAPHQLLSCTRSRLSVAQIDASKAVQVQTKVGQVLGVHGRIGSLEIDAAVGEIKIVGHEAQGQIVLDVGRQFTLTGVDGGRMLESRAADAEGGRLVLLAGRQAVVRFTMNKDTAPTTPPVTA